MEDRVIRRQAEENSCTPMDENEVAVIAYGHLRKRYETSDNPTKQLLSMTIPTEGKTKMKITAKVCGCHLDGDG